MSPQTLAPIPAGTSIVDKAGAITDFFRLRWQSLIDGFQTTPTINGISLRAQTDAIAPASAYTTLAAGLYRLSYYIRKTTVDGVSSSVAVTLGWTESGFAQSEAQPALTLDATTAEQSGSKIVWADADTDLTYAIAYASNTPHLMAFRIDLSVEKLA